MKDSELVSYRKAYHLYEVLETLEAGILLLGTEIKSLRQGGGSLQDNYIQIEKGEAWLKNASIAPYKFGNIHNHPERRDRKLLLHKSEIAKLKKETAIKGMTLIALAIYLKGGIAKIKIGLCKGKKAHDKRESLKKKILEREIKQS